MIAEILLAQQKLPDLTVKDMDGQIVVSWINDYKMPIANINIQRSYDSLKNYSTIGSVLNPQNTENGYVDNTPPYNKMYYRVFISFEGGTYVFSKIGRPVIEASPLSAEEIKNPFLYKNNSGVNPITSNKPNESKILPKTQLPNIEAKEIISYPSKRIFTVKDNSIVITLQDAEIKKYSVKFFDENNKLLFEIKEVSDNYLILEKVNFVHAGWFYFEVYENDKLIEKNKFLISKDK